MLSSIINHFASSASVNCFSDNTSTGSCDTGLPKVNVGSTELQTVLTIVFGITAAISVLMIIIGGMMFIFSGGNPQNTTKARETIIYAVVGLVVSLLAEMIVAFVLGRIKI